MLAKLQDSFSQLQQLTAYLDEVERVESQKNQSSTTIEIIEDTAAVEEKPEEKNEEKSEEKNEEKSEEKPEEKNEEKSEEKPEEKNEEKSEEKNEEKNEEKPEEKPESNATEEDSPISFLETNRLRCADLPFTIDENKKAKKTEEGDAVNIEITSIPVLLLDLKPVETMTTAAAVVSSLLETQYPVLPGEAVRMKNEKSYASVYRKSASEVLFTWVTYPSENERKEADQAQAQAQAESQSKPPAYTVLIEQGIQIASLIFKCTKTDDNTLTFEFNSESVEGWSADISSAMTNMVGRFFTSKKRRQGGQLVGKKAYMNLTRVSDDEVLFTWITYPRI